MGDQIIAKGMCHASVYHGMWSRRSNCSRKAISGSSFCKQHDPVNIELKRKQRDAAWDAEYKASEVKRAEAKKREARRDHYENCHGELVGILDEVLNAYNAPQEFSNRFNWDEWAKKAEASISKAKRRP